MRPRWSLWKQLKGKETGLGWDHEKGTISATDEWWAMKTKENLKFEAFREEGFELEIEHKMDQIFGCTAQGSLKFMPISNPTQQDLQQEDNEVMSTLETLGIFIYVLSKGASNRDTQERFQHYGETVSRIFKELLNVMDGFSRDMLVPKDLELKEIPPQIANDTSYMPHFKDCIGAIDDTHIVITVREEDQMRYRGRKGIPTTNVLAVCNFDLLFTYVLTRWEGSAHDARIFSDTINNPTLKFPRPPQGKYYLVDKGYPEREGYLMPYSKSRYHQSEFCGANPRGSREVSNRAHSSLRSCIERASGVLKARWKILQKCQYIH